MSQPPAVGEGSDRRARKRRQRSGEVYEAAIELFVERGYDATTMDDIAERADVARASVFNYFPRKAAFLEEWISQRRRGAVAAIQLERLEDKPIAAILGAYFDELARINLENRAETVALMPLTFGYIHTSPGSVPPLGDELAVYLMRAVERGEISSIVGPARVGLLLAYGYFATVLNWIAAEPAPFDLRDELHQMLGLVLSGILPPQEG